MGVEQPCAVRVSRRQGTYDCLHPTKQRPIGGRRRSRRLADAARSYGGQLVLTSERLVWQPFRISAYTVAHEHRVPIEAGGEWWELALVDVDRVEPDPKRRALLHIVARDGARISFLVADGRFGPVWSRKNEAARDRAIGRITDAIGRA